MMIIPNEILTIINIINGVYFYYIFGFIILIFYLFISLFTWSFIKPLLYMGVVNIIVGILFVLIKFSTALIITFIKNDIIKEIIPSVLKPLLFSGLICIASGILFLVIYRLIKRN